MQRQPTVTADEFMDLLLTYAYSQRDMNCSPFVRQYGILNNEWGVILCPKEYRTRAIHQNEEARMSCCPRHRALVAPQALLGIGVQRGENKMAFPLMPVGKASHNPSTEDRFAGKRPALYTLPFQARYAIMKETVMICDDATIVCRTAHTQYAIAGSGIHRIRASIREMISDDRPQDS